MCDRTDRLWNHCIAASALKTYSILDLGMAMIRVLPTSSGPADVFQIPYSLTACVILSRALLVAA